MDRVATTAPIGSPAASPLANVSSVGRHAERLGRGERPAAADAALHLVEDQHRAALVADAAGGAQELGRAVARAGQTLHRLHDHRGHGVVHRRLERGHVVERHLARQRDAGPGGASSYLRAVGAGERRGGAAVPSAAQRDDRLASGVPPRQVQARSRWLPRPSCRRTPAPADRDRAPPALRQRLPVGMRHRGRIEQQLRGLVGDGPHDVGMAVPGRGHRMTAVGVEPFVPSSSISHEPWPRTGRTGIWA